MDAQQQLIEQLIVERNALRAQTTSMYTIMEDYKQQLCTLTDAHAQLQNEFELLYQVSAQTPTSPRHVQAPVQVKYNHDLPILPQSLPPIDKLDTPVAQSPPVAPNEKLSDISRSIADDIVLQVLSESSLFKEDVPVIDKQLPDIVIEPSSTPSSVQDTAPLEKVKQLPESPETAQWPITANKEPVKEDNGQVIEPLKFDFSSDSLKSTPQRQPRYSKGRGNRKSYRKSVKSAADMPNFSFSPVIKQESTSPIMPLNFEVPSRVPSFTPNNDEPQDGDNTPLIRKASAEQVKVEPAESYLEQSIEVVVEQHEPYLINGVPIDTDARKQWLNESKDLGISVMYSAVRLNNSGKEYTVYVISVKDGENLLWHIQKRYSDFLELHGQLKSNQSKYVMNSIGKQPNQKLFNSHNGIAPLKSDNRRITLEIYLASVLLETKVKPWDLHTFLASDVLELTDRTAINVFDNSVKEGYLTKKGRHFNLWKRRYFVLQHDCLEYFESQESAALVAQNRKLASSSSGSPSLTPLGRIDMNGAKIASQKPPTFNSDKPKNNEQYLHGLLLSERTLTSTETPRRMILCAGSDFERDNWVYFLTRHVEYLRTGQSTSVAKHVVLPTVEPQVQETQPAVKRDIKEDRKSRASKLVEWASDKLTSDRSKTHGQENRKSIFGASLDDAVSFSKAMPDYELPSIVYRCIEYLDAKHAYNEEGIYRISGSSAEIKNLQARFDTEGDVDLLQLPKQPDVHAVAGLLKLYLRSLPQSLLTAQLHRDFLHVTDLTHMSDRIIELARLVSMLPVSNYTLLRSLVSHLIGIVQHAEKNKMTARNVGIVFSPSMGIPAGIFMLMLSEFEFIFWVNAGDEEVQDEITDEVVEETTGYDKRKSWRSSQVIVEGRSNRNSQIFEDAAPVVIKEQELTNMAADGEILVADYELDDIELVKKDDSQITDRHSRVISVYDVYTTEDYINMMDEGRRVSAQTAIDIHEETFADDVEVFDVDY